LHGRALQEKELCRRLTIIVYTSAGLLVKSTGLLIFLRLASDPEIFQVLVAASAVWPRMNGKDVAEMEWWPQKKLTVNCFL
jgi:hypothetical protein